MGRNTRNKKGLFLLTAIILLVFLVPLKQANGAWLTDWLGGKLIDSSLGAIFTALSSFFISLVGEAIRWAAGLLDSWIQFMPVSGVFFVDESWKIIRNFVNMLFILVLILMAFGTIFDIKRYTWREMLPSFIIAALLINFSLAIGQYIVGVANGLASVFLTEVGVVSHAFGDGLELAKIMGANGPGALDSAGDLVITAIFGILFLLITFLALISTAIFVLARTVIIWFLLIISPIAWFGYTLPNMRAGTWSKWWSTFLCWCFFLPYYLFFLMFALIFIGNKDRIPLPYEAATGSILNQSLSVSTLLTYSISLVFLIGGLHYAKKLACASGSYVGKVFGNIESGVRKYAPGAAYARGAMAGIKDRGAEIKEKGVLGFGGAQRGRLDEAVARGWVAGIPGLGRVPGAREAASKAQAAEVDKEIKRLQTLNLTLDQLNDKLKTAKGVEKIAAFKLKAEAGWLQSTDLDEINKMLAAAGGGKTAVGASIINSLKKGKFEEMAEGTEAKERIYATLQDADVKKAYGRSMAESGELRDTAIARSLLNLYQNETQAEQDSVKKLVQKNLENMYRNKSERSAFITAPVTDDLDRQLKRMAAQVMIDKGEVDLALREGIIDLHGGRDGAGKIKEKQMQELDKKILTNIEKGKISEALLAPADQKAIFDSITEPEVQKAFGMAMAKNRAVMEEDVATKIIDLYSNDTLEVQEKVHEEIKKNIEQMADTKDKNLRTAYLFDPSRNATMKKLVGQIMVDKKEATNWQARREILNLNGGIDPMTGNPLTADGRDLAKSMKENNVLFKEEEDYRKATATRPAIPHNVDLTPAQRGEVKEQILTNVENKFITSFSTEELQTPEVFNALYDGVRTGRISLEKFDQLAGLSTGRKGGGKPDRKKREAGAKIAEAAFRGGGPMAY